MTLATEVMVLASVAGVAVLLVRVLQKYLHFRRLELAIPGPPSLPLVGNGLEFANMNPDDVMPKLLRLIAGRRAMTRFSIFCNLFVVIQDPAEIEELTRRKEFNDKSVFVYSLLHVIARRGLIQLGGNDWRDHRRWLAPGFNKNVLDRFVEVFSEEAQSFVDRMVVDKEVDVIQSLRLAAMRNFLRTSMSSDTSDFEPVVMKIVEFVEEFLRSINRRSFNPLLWSDVLFTMTPLGKEIRRMRQVIDDTTRTFIDKKRTELKAGNSTDFEQARKTLVDILMDDSANSKQMPEQDIMDEFKTFLGANVETTVSALSMMLKVLSILPEVQQQAHAELDAVFRGSDRPITFEDLPELKYIERVVKECLRMFPPIPFTGRQCYAETKLCGHTIPAGTAIGINIFGAHRDPQHWDNPDSFDPDRFLPERCKDRHPCAYIPFSTGLRNCIGGRYAMYNLTTFVATTLRTYRLLPADDHKDVQSLTDNMSFDITAKLVGGVRVKFQRRREQSASGA